MKLLGKGDVEQLSLLLVIGLILAGVTFLGSAAARRLAAATPTPTPKATPTATPPPAAVLLQAELEADLAGVMILANDRTFGTAFLIDPRGDLLTAASLVSDATSLRLIDNTGGSHQVRVIGVDPVNDVAEIRADGGGIPMPFGDPRTLQRGDTTIVLASAKVANLRTTTPAFVDQVGVARLGMTADDLPGNIGSPVVGPGGKVLAVFLHNGAALRIDQVQGDLAQWRAEPGVVLPLAPVPGTLVLRGTDETSKSNAAASIQSITPARASAAHDTVVTIQGSGFSAGPKLRVLFLPVASPDGAFAGAAPTVAGPTSMTVKVPAGQRVQDYVVQLVNGDGILAGSSGAYTVTP